MHTGRQVHLAPGGDEPVGQLIQFYVGDPEEVGAAFSEADFDRLADSRIVPLSVDFSLHLSPIDFDLLSVEVDKVVKTRACSFMEALETNVGGTLPESSADVVAVEWVHSLASLPDEQVDDVVSSWTKALAIEYDDAGIQPTDETRAALHSLVELCRGALRLGLPVIHGWSL